MAGNTTLTVRDLVDELDERLDDIAAEANQEEDGSDDQIELDQLGATLDQRLASLEELEEDVGADAQFVIAELGIDERMRFGDLLEAAREQAKKRRGFESGSNLRDVFWTGAAIVDAPWLEGDESMQDRVAALRQRDDWHVLQHLKEKVTEVNSKGNRERRSYAQRRAERTQTSERN